MAKAPDDAVLNQTIATLDGEIAREWGRINGVMAAYEGTSPQKDLINEFTRVRNLMTRRHMLEVQRTYVSGPNGRALRFLYEVEFLSLRDADGNELVVRKGRFADGGVLGDRLKLIEVKTEQSVIDAVSKKGNPFKASFNESAIIGKQIGIEKSILKWGNKKGVALWFRVLDPLTMTRTEVEVPLSDVQVSAVQTYNNMGDGFDISSLFHDTPSRGGTIAIGGGGGKPGGTTEPKQESSTEDPPLSRKAVENKGTENRGTGEDPKRKTTETERRSEYKETSNREVSRFAYEVDPGGVLEQAHGVTAAWEGAAMMLYDKMLENLYEEAFQSANRALGEEEISNAIFKSRQNGNWILVIVNLLETEAPDAQGNRPVTFWGVDFKDAAPRNVEQDNPETMLGRLRQTRTPPSVNRSWQPSEQRDSPRGWRYKTVEYQLMPPFDRISAPKMPVQQWMPWQRQEEQRRIRGTSGTCTK